MSLMDKDTEFQEKLQKEKYETMRRDQRIKVRRISELNQGMKKHQILFTGSSLMELFPIEELRVSLDIEPVIYNRGIGGFTTDDFLENIHPMLLEPEPSKVFINIGTNDIADRETKEGHWLTHLIVNYEAILKKLKSALPECEVYMMSYYPVNLEKLRAGAGKDAVIVRTNENVNRANQAVKDLSEKYGYHYIDVNQGLTDENGELKQEFTMDGIHMYPDAYKIVLENMKPYL
mgnify:CR=1 FL=1